MNVYGTSDSIDPELSTGAQASVTRSSSSAAQTATRSAASGSLSVTGTTTGADRNMVPTQTPVSDAGSLGAGSWIGGGVAVVAAWGLF